MISIVSSSIAIHKFSFYLSPNPVSFVDSFILVIPVASRNYNLTKFLSLFFPPPLLGSSLTGVAGDWREENYEIASLLLQALHL